MDDSANSNAAFLRQFSDAQDRFSSVVEQVAVDQWTLPTPCTEWDVRALVNHLVGEQVWAPPLVEGKTIAEVGDQFDGDLLGDFPLRTWKSSAAASRSAFSFPEALAGSVHTSMGSQPTTDYLRDMTTDLITHRWDLGEGIGQRQKFTADELSQLEDAQRRFAPIQEELVKAGVFAAPIEVPADADPQTRVLAALGRVN